MAAPSGGDRGHIPSAARTTASYAAWEHFLTRCLTTRLDFDKFAAFAPLQAAHSPLGPVMVADLFLRPTPWNRYTLDPLIPHFLQTLMDQGLVDLAAMLAGLWRYSTGHELAAGQHKAEEDGGGGEIKRWESSFSSEEVMFYRITKLVASGNAIRNGRETVDVCLAMARWMVLFTEASAAFNEDVMMGGVAADLGPGRQRRDDMENSRAAFVMLLLAVCENPVVLQNLSKPFAKDARRALSQSLASFVPSIMQSASQVAARFESFRTQTLAAFDPVDKKKAAADAEMNELLDETLGLQNITLPHVEIARSRAGLYIYLNAALIGRPLLDDASIHNYLRNRFEGDIQSTAIDLILASFDVLANAIFKNEGQKSAHLLRSYLINKVPLILASFAASVNANQIYPFDSESCITNALSRVDPNTFPTLSSLFDEGENSLNNNPFTESVRSDFVTACCLHGLVPETSIDKLIGDYAYQTLPAGGRYVKETLVQECVADQDRMLRLVTELDKMEGNAGAVCQALTEVLRQLCTNKETMTLKLLCSQLARNPLNLDVLLLFDKTTAIITPICELLDNWRYEDDQGEYQPVYEEFGSILLLLLAFVYRYNLSASDLGTRSPDSFIAKLLGKGQLSRTLDDLSEQENSQLGGWIQGLFDNDGGGLADELLSSCPPQSLYLLIPTLFHNIVLAVTNGYLTVEGLKTGVEYLLEPFLLPCLVPAIIYLSKCLWTDRPEENKAIIQILQLILKPSQKMSAESSEMLNSVRNIVAKPLESGLRTFLRQNPKSQDVEPLLHVLKENIELSRRTGAASDKELETWTGSSSGGGLITNIKHTIHSLTMWSMQHTAMMPSPYAHRQMLVGLRFLGAKRVLYAILDELKQQTEAGSGSISYGYDVAVSLVCAPDVTNTADTQQHHNLGEVASASSSASPPRPPQQRRLTLREALRWEAEAWKKMQKQDPAIAEIVVRLHQRVEKQMMVVQPQAAAIDMPMAMAEALTADQAAAMVAADPMGTLDTAAVAGLPPLDLSGGGGDPNGGGEGPSSAGGLDFGGAGGDDWDLGLNGWVADMELS